jgi:hypothetical protein
MTTLVQVELNKLRRRRWLILAQGWNNPGLVRLKQLRRHDGFSIDYPRCLY